MTDPQTQQIRNQIAFGMDCRAFMESQMGEYLAARANADIDAATEALKTVDPEDPRAIRALQNAVKVGESFLIWMGEAVTNGENAELTFIEAGR